MPLIKIEELDLTSAGNRSQENDVIYIPGLVDINQSDLYVEGEYVGLKPFEPTYIEDLSTFKTLVGDRGVVFEEDQLYTDLIEEIDGEYFGFDENAIPYSKVMFRKGQVDPSYVMAKELLAAGLPIVYERINKDPVLEKVTSEPTGWGVLDKFGYGIHQDYYQNIKGFEHIKSTTAPKLFVKYTTYNEQVGSVELYEREEKDGIYRYTPAKDAKGNSITASLDLIVPDDKTYYYYTGLKVSKPGSVPLALNSVTIFERNTNSNGDFEYTEVKDKPKYGGTDTYYIETYGYEDVPNADFVEVTIDDEDLPTFSENTFYKFVDNKYEPIPESEWIKGTIQSYYYVSPKFEAGKYYQLIEDEYTEVKESANWDPFTNTYYTKEVVYTEINYAEYIDKTCGPIYTFREDLDLYVQINPNDSKKYEYTDLFIFTSYPYPITVKDEEENEILIRYEVRKDFINKFNEYCIEGSSLESLEDVAVAPEFKDIYINNTYLDIKSIYNSLSEVFSLDRDNALTDMGNVNIKYITSGGYPTYEYRGNEIATKMIKVAKTRGDAFAFIDHTNNSDRTTNMSQPSSLYAVVKDDSSIQADGEFGTMFTPYMNFVRTTKDDTIVGQSYNPQIEMSGTYAYLMCLANSIKVNPAWLAVAGAARGLVPNLQQVATNTPISNGNADKMQPRDGVSINAITEIKPYGYTIWGNRTLKNNGTEGNLKATSFLNIRNLVCDIKKVAYSTARALTFEQNNDILWINFQSKLTPILDKMKSGYGISGYKIVRNTEHEKANEKATLCANIIIYPTYAVEDFYITVVLTDDEVGVEE